MPVEGCGGEVEAGPTIPKAPSLPATQQLRPRRLKAGLALHFHGQESLGEEEGTEGFCRRGAQAQKRCGTYSKSHSR